MLTIFNAQGSILLILMQILSPNILLSLRKSVGAFKQPLDFLHISLDMY